MMDFSGNSNFVISSQISSFGGKLANFMFVFGQIYDNYTSSLCCHYDNHWLSMSMLLSSLLVFSNISA